VLVVFVVQHEIRVGDAKVKLLGLEFFVFSRQGWDGGRRFVSARPPSDVPVGAEKPTFVSRRLK
jgi:hypothetical protein